MCAPLALLVALLPTTPRAQTGEPDAAYRDALTWLREAARDTVGHGGDPARLDTLGVALLQVGRTTDAGRVFARALAADSVNRTAQAALGKLALFAGRLDEARERLAAAGDADGAAADRYAASLRAGDWRAAAAEATAASDEGRVPLLEALAEGGAWALSPGPDRGRVLFERTWPVPVIDVKLNGRRVRMVVDPGLEDMLVDPSAFRVCKLEAVPGERGVMWNGSRIAVRNAIAPSLEIAGMTLTTVPAGVFELHRYSRETVPQEPDLAGVIGLQALRRFVPTIDWTNARLELARPGTTIPAGGTRVPFELWGEGELMVQGTLAGSRRLWILLGTGLPSAGVGAPEALFSELGIKPGVMARLVKGAGQYLQGNPWAQATVSTVTVGPLASDRMRAWVGAFDTAEVLRHGVRRDAMLGPDFFRGRRMTIDWDRQELVFEEK